MARTLRFEDHRIHLFILKNDDNEEVERWINELIQTLKTKNIVCIKEGDYEKVGENVYASLERAMLSVENVMAVLSDGFVSSKYLMFRFQLALQNCLERQIPFLPVISINFLEPPLELTTTVCLKVDFSEKLRQTDVKKIEQALNLADKRPATFSDLENVMLIFDEKIRAGSPAELFQLSSLPEFKELLSFLNDINNRYNGQDKEENDGHRKRIIVKRSKSDASVIKSVKGRKPRIHKVSKSNSFNYQKKQFTLYPCDSLVLTKVNSG